MEELECLVWYVAVPLDTAGGYQVWHQRRTRESPADSHLSSSGASMAWGMPQAMSTARLDLDVGEVAA